jgi:hypothetical protein
MLVAGTRDGKSYSEAKQIFNKIEKHHITDAAVPDKSKQSLWLIEPDTELSGTKLVDPRTRLNISQQISMFIATRLADRPDFKWEDRKSPLDGQ